MKEKNIITYVNAALFIALLVVMGVSIRGIGRSIKSLPAEARREAVPAKEEPAAARIYDIQKVKGRESKTVQAPKDLTDVFTGYSTRDVGSNIITDWEKISPEDKAKFIEVVDKKIVDLKERLKADPNDKKAKKILFISESMKSLALNNFNYAFNEDKR